MAPSYGIWHQFYGLLDNIRVYEQYERLLFVGVCECLLVTW